MGPTGARLTFGDAVFQELATPLRQHFDAAPREVENIDPHEPSLVAVDDEALVRRVRRAASPAGIELQRRLGARKDPSKLVVLVRAVLSKKIAAEFGIGGKRA